MSFISTFLQLMFKFFLSCSYRVLGISLRHRLILSKLTYKASQLKIIICCDDIKLIIILCSSITIWVFLILTCSLFHTTKRRIFFQYLLLVINLTFTIIGIFANSFGLLFFIKKQRKDITTILFIALCIVDLATVLTLGPLQMLINVSAINFFDFSTGNFILFSIFSALSNFEV